MESDAELGKLLEAFTGAFGEDSDEALALVKAIHEEISQETEDRLVKLFELMTSAVMHQIEPEIEKLVNRSEAIAWQGAAQHTRWLMEGYAAGILGALTPFMNSEEAKSLTTVVQKGAVDYARKKSTEAGGN